MKIVCDFPSMFYLIGYSRDMASSALPIITSRKCERGAEPCLATKGKVMSTTEISQRDLLLSEYSDTYKEIYWHRPSLAGMDELTLDELQSMVDGLYQQAAESYRQERRREIKREEEVLKTLARLSPMAGGMSNAIRWLHQSEGTNGDEGMLEWSLGVGYGFFAWLRAA